MKSRKYLMIAAAFTFAFCLCQEENKNPIGPDANEAFFGAWKGTVWTDVFYDNNGTKTAEAPRAFLGYYKITAENLTVYQLTDTCDLILGPYNYTAKGDTILYTMPTTPPMDMKLSLANGIMRHWTQFPLIDSTGKPAGHVESIVDHEKYGNSIPESSWPQDPCSMGF